MLILLRELPLKWRGKKCPPQVLVNLGGRWEAHLRIIGENYEELLLVAVGYESQWGSVSVSSQGPTAFCCTHRTPNIIRWCCRSSYLVQEHKSCLRSQAKVCHVKKTMVFGDFFFWQKGNLLNMEQRVGWNLPLDKKILLIRLRYKG